MQLPIWYYTINSPIYDQNGLLMLNYVCCAFSLSKIGHLCIIFLWIMADKCAILEM